jgi:hypothetical protein
MSEKIDRGGKDRVEESVLDRPRAEGLDPDVWEKGDGGAWRLRPGAESAISKVAGWAA